MVTQNTWRRCEEKTVFLEVHKIKLKTAAGDLNKHVRVYFWVTSISKHHDIFFSFNTRIEKSDIESL